MSWTLRGLHIIFSSCLFPLLVMLVSLFFFPPFDALIIKKLKAFKVPMWLWMCNELQQGILTQNDGIKLTLRLTSCYDNMAFALQRRLKNEVQHREKKKSKVTMFTFRAQCMCWKSKKDFLLFSVLLKKWRLDKKMKMACLDRILPATFHKKVLNSSPAQYFSVHTLGWGWLSYHTSI